MKKYILKNGLRALFAPQNETKAVTVLVLVGVGSRYEKESQAGMAHFLEHMVFKGTARRPTTLALSRELDRVGAEYNAYTSNDHTGYWIKINSEYLELALDVLSDMVFNSKLEEKEIKREKGTIIEEINMYEDSPMKYSGVLLNQILFKGNSLSRDVIGSKKTIRAVTSQKMKNFKNKFYAPKNMVVSVAGGVDGGRAKKMVERYFGEINTARYVSIKFKKFKTTQNKPQVKLKYKETEQVHLAFGFVGPKYKDHDLETAQILSVILGGSMSSRLFIQVRERRGLCYYIRSGLDVFQDTGSLVIQAGLDKERIKPAIELILKELRKIKTKGITEEELKRAKEHIKGKMVLDLEDSSLVADWYGRQQLLVGKTKTPEKKIAELMKVTQAQVNREARKMFQTKKVNLALIGPFKSEKDFWGLLKV